jgi:glycosyltransferase involved in cell wall biosynthesis
MQPQLVSVVIPAYNAQQFVGQAIDSVLAQTYRQFEIIVVDDGSIDDTRLIVQQFGSAVRYIYQPNRGLSAARNTAIRNARAEIIALLDADDLWEPEFLTKMVAQLDRHPEAAAVYCGFRYIDAHGEVKGEPSLKIAPPNRFYETLICKGNWLVPCAVIFRKRLAEEAGLFDESLRASEDADLWTRLSALYPFVGVPEGLAMYRRHDSNMTKDPERMVNANYQRTEKRFGPPEGDISSWPELKHCAYVRLFRYGASRYLAFGDVAKSAYYFQRLFELSPSLALSMNVWREFARVHLPDEEKHEPVVRLNCELAQRDIFNLLSELANSATNSPVLQSQYNKIKGCACLALAEEAGQAGELVRAFRWLWRVARSYSPLILSRSYWGAVQRCILRVAVARKIV